MTSLNKSSKNPFHIIQAVCTTSVWYVTKALGFGWGGDFLCQTMSPKLWFLNKVDLLSAVFILSYLIANNFKYWNLPLCNLSLGICSNHWQMSAWNFLSVLDFIFFLSKIFTSSSYEVSSVNSNSASC